MPITKREFELGIDEDIESWMQKIYARLSTNPELAYSAEEVQEGLLHDTHAKSKPWKKLAPNIRFIVPTTF